MDQGGIISSAPSGREKKTKRVLWERNQKRRYFAGQIKIQPKLFKDDLEIDIEEMQYNFEKEKNRIDREMNFVEMDPENMSPEMKRI